MWEAALKMVDAIVPPSDGDRQYGWRWRVFGFLSGTMLVVVMFVIFSFSSYGFAGKSDLDKKANKSDVDRVLLAVSDLAKVQQRMTDDTVIRDIHSSVEKYCASKDGMRAIYLTELQDNLIRYQDRHPGMSYPQQIPPPCYR
jgi:hypothetical protein